MPTGPRFADLGQWLDWQQALHPDAIDLGLERAGRVLARTGWRAPACPVITVGGTNGKGSCVALLDAMLRAAGLRTGCFTSPHLVEYLERIRIDGEPASEVSVMAAFERIGDALDGETLTFFEFNALAALLVFETACVDAVVLEVGMGGRLDAVNLVDADVAVIVSVGVDHAEWLGPDLESIGREKAGILRPGRPAIVGTPSPPKSVLEAARALGADLRLRGRDFEGRPRDDDGWDYTDRCGTLAGLPRPALAGDIQIANAATALAALRALGNRLAVGRDAIGTGLGRARLAGRFQRITDARGFEWVLDVAHNADAARVLAANLERYPVPGRTIAVCGMLADKDVPAVTRALGDSVSRWFAAGTDGPRGFTASELVARSGLAMEEGGSVSDAMERAAGVAAPGDRVVVFGSFHTVGPALVHLQVRGAGADRGCLWL
jgi:dihydrofolate synthase/folylpolyglutamate synthase